MTLLRKSEVYLSERKASSLECGALHLGLVQVRRRSAGIKTLRAQNYNKVHRPFRPSYLLSFQGVSFCGRLKILHLLIVYFNKNFIILMIRKTNSKKCVILQKSQIVQAPCFHQATSTYGRLKFASSPSLTVRSRAGNLKEALVAMPIFLKQMVHAGSGRPALVGALQGANIGVGVATSASTGSDLISLGSATLAAIGVVREGPVRGREIAIPLVGISGLMGSIGSQIYFGGLMSGATCQDTCRTSHCLFIRCA
jgi:hypothetical protein